MIRKRLLAYTIMILSLVMSVKLTRDIYRLWHTDERILEAEKELAEAKDKQVELKKLLEDSQSKFENEKQIRNVLKMAKKNEVVVVVPEELMQLKNKNGKIVPREKEDISNIRKWLRVFML